MFWAIVSFVNVEAIAVKYNISTQYEQGEFDFDSIYWLSADASNVIYEFYTDNHEDFSEDELKGVRSYYHLLYYDRLMFSLQEYCKANSIENWREFNIADMSKYNAGMRILKTRY